MSEDYGTDLEVQPPSELARELVTDDEIRRYFRLAEACFASGMYGDVKNAERAFVKMVIGHELGIAPMQALGAIHLVDGNVQVHYAMLAHFIRSRPGYSYRAGWLKDRTLEAALAASVDVGETVDAVEVVWMDEEDPADLREVTGAVVVVTVDGQQQGVSRFTLADAQLAGLVKDRSAWKTAPRNMLLARAMSNAVKWFAPEVASGLPLYVEGEVTERPQLSAGTGSGEPQGLDLGPKVDAIIERAQALGHAGLSDRASLEVLLGSRSPKIVNAWVAKSKLELDAMEAEQAAAAEAAAEHEQAVDEANAELAVEAEQAADAVAGAED